MTNEPKYLLDTIKSLLHDEPKPDEKVSDYSAAIDYEKVFRLAKFSGVANMAAYRICTNESVPEDIRKKFDLERMKITAQQIKQGVAISELKEIFDLYKAKGIILKGSIIKDFYPVSYMRSMSDIDFFMEEEDILRIRDAVVGKGFKAGLQGSNSHYVFEKYDIVDVELHYDIERADGNYGKEIFSKRFPEGLTIQDAMDVWEHTMPVEGSSYMLQLTPEYHYLYIVMHMMKHFMSSGTGTRSFIDVWVMNHHYGAQWNRAELNELLDRFGLLKFEQYALALADRWFVLDDKNCISMDIDEDALDQLEEHILKSGTYGLWDNHMLKNMDHNTSAESKLRYLMGRVFKPLAVMKNFYPILNKAPVLLPAMWLRRIFDLLTKKGRKSLYKLHSVAHANQEQADKLKDLFEKVI